MKLKNEDFLVARAGFNDLVHRELPVSVAVRVRRVAFKVNDTLTAFDAVLKDLRDKHKITRDTRTDSTEAVAFSAEYKELLDAEVEWAEEKVKLPAVVKGEPLVMPTATLINLDKFIEIDGA